MDLFGEEPAPEKEEQEVQEQIEEFAGLQSPKDSAFCLGHGDVEQKLLGLYNVGKFHHGLILAGPEGIGKFTFAYRLARFLLAQKIEDPNQDALFADPEPAAPPQSMDIAQEHPVFSRVASGGHSDLLVIERAYDTAKNAYKAGVDVAEIRKVAPFLRMTSGEGGWRVVIINDADTMNPNAQNALLKILEEPPEHTALILVTHRPGALIPTIRSRTQSWNLSALSQDNMRALLQKQGHVLSAVELDALYGLSGGSIGRALHFLDEGGLDVMGRIFDVFQNYPNFRWQDIHVMSEDLSRASNPAAYQAFANVMRWTTRQMSVAKARGQALSNGPLANPVFQELLAEKSLQDLVALNDNIQEHFARHERANLEKRLSVLKAFGLFAA